MVEKKVTFDLSKNKTRVMYVYLFAAQKARKGEWEEMARDSMRFKRRIMREFEPVLSKVLTIKHRNKIYNNLYGVHD